jgi:hypothetical protein
MQQQQQIVMTTTSIYVYSKTPKIGIVDDRQTKTEFAPNVELV